MIIFKAPQGKHVVTVFTDITCGYCFKLHDQIKNCNALGVTNRYLTFLSQGLNSQTELDTASAWRSANPKDTITQAMSGGNITQAMSGGNIQLATCDINTNKYYTLGVQYGIQSKPALLLDEQYYNPVIKAKKSWPPSRN